MAQLNASIADIELLNQKLMFLQQVNEAITKRLDEGQGSSSSIWLLVTTFGIFFMQTGFLLLEAGAVRSKNARSIMIKNLCDACFGSLAWYFIGYSIFNNGTFAIVNNEDSFVGWFQSYAFAVTTSTIVSGGVACRMKFMPYMIFSMVMCAWIYPWIARWAWVPGNWLADMGYLDFAGSGPVHALGGIAAFIGAHALGPRVSRFNSYGEDLSIKGHSDTLFVLGASILWFGWFSFNGGSSGGASTDQINATKRAIMNTLLSSTASGVTSIFYSIFRLKTHNIGYVVNGILGGLVAITAGCAFVDTWAALVIGFISPFLTIGSSNLLCKLKIDDPLDATAVHFTNGVAGVLFTGIFHNTLGIFASGKFDLFMTQLIGIVVMISWSGIHAAVFFYLIGRVYNLRVERDDELVGLDFKYCDGYAFEKFDGNAIMEFSQIKEAENRIRNRFNAGCDDVRSQSSIGSGKANLVQVKPKE